MKLFFLTALTMVAFAANSVLNRFALAHGEIDPFSFAAIRLWSGALALCILVLLRDRRLTIWGRYRLVGAVSLLLYIVGFSTAYVALDTGVGALILFGGVQITMFAGALVAREIIPAARWLGAGLAFAGLTWLLWPGGTGAVPLIWAVAMCIAALGWGVYSLVGRGMTDPLGSTAGNFLVASPVLLAMLPLLPAQLDATPTTPVGITLAVVSGVVTSGLGYALWYSVLPRLPSSSAAVAQLTVPVIAFAGGVVFLGEPLTWRFVIASLLVLSGVALASRSGRSSSAEK